MLPPTEDLERHGGLRLFAGASLASCTVQTDFGWTLLDALLMLAMEIAIRDNRRLLEQAAGRDVEGEADELGVCPFQRGGR